MSAAPVPAPQRDLDELLLGKRASLHPIFNPKTVAVIAADEHSMAVADRTLSTLLRTSFPGKLFAVHPGLATVQGIRAFPSISGVPGPVDLAVIVAAGEGLPEIVDECVRAGVRGAVALGDVSYQPAVWSSQLQSVIREKLRGSRMRLLGPGCLGMMNPSAELNATAGLQMPLGGTVAFLTQSGALASAMLDWSLKEIVGFSAFVSVGAMLDIGWGDLIDYFGNDPGTQAILIYMESSDNIRSFLSSAREVSLNKPIIVIKSGRTGAAIAAVGHGQCLLTDDAVLDAAFRRVGVLRVDDTTDLFYCADALSKQPRPRGPRLGVVSNATTFGVLAADAVVASGGALAQFSPTTWQQLSELLPCGRGDLLHDRCAEDYAKAVEIAAQDANCDGLLLAIVPPAFADPRRAAELLLNVENTSGKPVLACFLGGDNATPQELVTRAFIPTLPSPRAASRVFNYMWRYTYNLRGIYETPVLRADVTESTLRRLAESMIHSARDAGRNVLTGSEAKALLAAYGIPVLDSRVARSEEEAVRIAGEIGFPVVLTLTPESSEQVEFQAMPRTLNDAEAVRRAWRSIASRLKEKPDAALVLNLRAAVKLDGYELRISSRIDPQFGPVLVFAAGGKLADVLQDRAVGLPPLNATLARRMMEQTRIYSVLQPAGGHARADLAALEALLVRFSQLLGEQPWVKEIDIELSASPTHLLALAAHVVVHGPEVRQDMLPRPAIRPYPVQYVSAWTMKDGQPVTIRPIRAEDEPLMMKFHERLSDRSVYLRFFQGLALTQRTSHDRLTRICFIDYDREIALVAERSDPHTQERQIIALGNLTKGHRRNQAEIAAITSDDYQGRGLGSEMFRRLLRVAGDEKIERVVATTMPENRQMCAMLKRFGFRLTTNLEDNTVEAELDLPRH